MKHRIHIETFTLGDWATNCYVVRLSNRQENDGPCWIIDAGFSPEPMIEYVRANRLRPRQVLLTHAHLDHIAGLHAIRAAWSGVPILIHEAEKDFLTDCYLNLSIALDEPVIAPDATEFLVPGQTIALEDVSFEIRHTPGHSPGGVSLYQPEEKAVIVGDALFSGSIGRTDFPTSNHEALIKGIREQLLTLPDDVKVYPGHGPTTTIGQEKRTNPYVR